MLTDAELESLMDKHGLDQKARTVIKGIRASDPSRLVNSGGGNVSCRYPSKKMGQVIQAESHTCELATIIQWEHDDSVYEFYDQCPVIKLSYRDVDGKRCGHYHTPDFFLIAEDYIGWVECKAQTWLEARALKSALWVQTDGLWRYTAGEAYAAQFGLGFKVIVDTAINQIWVRNLNFLADFFDVNCPSVEPDIEAQVLDAFEGKNFAALARLLAFGDGALAGSIYKLIADDRLYANLESQLLVDVPFAHIFRDQRTAEAFRLTRHAEVAQREVETVSAIYIETGRSFTWDGKPWTIINAGQDKVSIKDESGLMQSLTRAQLLNLVKSGEVQGENFSKPSTFDEVSQIIALASEEDLREADRRAKVLEDMKAGKTPKECERTLRTWRSRMRYSNQLLGNDFVGLISRHRACGNWNRRLSPAVLELIQAVIREFLLGTSAKTKQACYAILCAKCDEAGFIAPSRKTFGKEIRKIATVHAQVRARFGPKAAYALSDIVHWRLDNAVPAHGDRAFEIAHIDHTQMDVQLVDSVYGEPIGKPWLTVLMDAFTRKVLAFVITLKKPSYLSCMLVMRECIRAHHRVPANIVCDKGSEFFSTYWEVLLARLNVTKKTRPTAKGRYGSVIERLFGKFNTDLLHQLSGNNTPLQNPRAMSGSHDPRKKAIWTLAELTVQFEKYLEETYSELKHPALGVTPRLAEEVSLRNSGTRHVRLLTWNPSLALLCLPDVKGGERRIFAGRGIWWQDTYYYHPRMSEPALMDTKVPVRYDPFDFGVIYAKVGGHWLPCSCPAISELANRPAFEVRMMTLEMGALKSDAAVEMYNNIKRGKAILDAHETEQRLMQEKRDREHQISETNSEKTPAGHSPVAGEAPAEVDPNQLIDDDDIDSYGEFK
ncbi:DDE-type integrase/transposase/recombinase [Herbaspirillum huttiense]|uniref:DDE-type integrase/transposase/recombinase n=1 Tax=Herbaspirillum huttiense TaxID=863372 RepID=UPI0031DE39F3